MNEKVELMSLNCSNYSQLLVEGISHLYKNQSRTDIIISADDFEIKVHQMMIAIFAPSLLDIIEGSKCDLSGIRIDGGVHVLSTIFDFIYTGKAEIAKCDLENLKTTAAQLNFTHLVNSIDECQHIPKDAGLKEKAVALRKSKRLIKSKDEGKSENIEFADVTSSEEINVSGETILVQVLDLEGTNSADIEKNEPTFGKINSKKKLMLRCPECAFQTDVHAHFLKHISSTHNADAINNCLLVRYRCVDCEHTYPSRSELLKHRKFEHDRKRLRKCPNCSFSSKQKRILDRHVQNVHSKDRPFACQQCDYRAKSAADIYAHRTVHRGEFFKCKVCSARIASKKNFNKHMKIHENPEVHKQPYRCHRCSFRSWTKALLKKHLSRVHHCEMPETSDPKTKVNVPDEGWKCSLCRFETKEFNKWRDHLAVKHQLDVEGNKLDPKLRCSICNYACYVQSQMRRHKILIHSEKRFKCGFCDYVSYNNTRVSYHVKAKHFAEKAFMCDTCGMRFVTNFLLRRHVQTHGAKKFSCELCKKSFAVESYLKKHVNLMHDKSVRKHMCHVCVFVTKTKDALNQHIKRMHKQIDCDAVVEEPVINPAIVVEEIPL